MSGTKSTLRFWDPNIQFSVVKPWNICICRMISVCWTNENLEYGTVTTQGKCHPVLPNEAVGIVCVCK